MLSGLSAPARAARPNQLPPACRPSPATLHEQDRPVRLAMQMSFSAQDGSDHLYILDLQEKCPFFPIATWPVFLLQGEVVNSGEPRLDRAGSDMVGGPQLTRRRVDASTGCCRTESRPPPPTLL